MSKPNSIDKRSHTHFLTLVTHFAASLLEEVSDLQTMVLAAEVVTVRGIPLTVGAVRNADSHQAHGALIALLTTSSR
jgi:hypothetical protein